MSKKINNQEEDTDYMDEMGGGSDAKKKPLTREAFLKMLSKISRLLEKPSDEEKSETNDYLLSRDTHQIFFIKE